MTSTPANKIKFNADNRIVDDGLLVFSTTLKKYVHKHSILACEMPNSTWIKNDGFYQKTIPINSNGSYISTAYFSASAKPKDTVHNYFVNRSQPGLGKTTNIKEKIKFAGEDTQYAFDNAVEDAESTPKSKNKDRKVVSPTTYLVLCSEYAQCTQYAGLPHCIVMDKFEKTCDLYKYREDIRKMYDGGDGLRPSLICMYKAYQSKKNGGKTKCESNDSCKYKQQMKERKGNVSVVGILHTAPIFDFVKYKQVIYEENTTGKKKLKFDRVEFANEFMKLKHLFVSSNEKRNEEFLNLIKKISEGTITYSYLKKLSDDLFDAIIETNNIAAKHSKSFKEFMSTAFTLYLDDVLQFLKYRKMNPNRTKIGKFEEISVPWTYIIFDYMVQYPDANFLHLSSSFQVEMTKHHIKVWERLTPGHRIKMIIKNSNFTSDTEIRVYKDDRVTTNNIEEMTPIIKNELKKIRERCRYRTKKEGMEHKVLVLTKKKWITLENKNDNIGTFMGFTATHFGANHGINQFSDYSTLVVIGSHIPNPNDLKDMFAELYPKESLQSQLIPKITDDGLSYYYSDPRLQLIYKEKFEDSERDSIHRLRPLIQNKGSKYNKEVYVFGLIPSGLIEEDGFNTIIEKITQKKGKKRKNDSVNQ